MDFSYRIDAEEIKQHQEAITNDNQDLRKSFHLAHPLFYTKINWEITRRLNDFLEQPVDENILKTLVHQSENITIFQPLKDGTNLTVKTKFWSIEPHSKGTKLMIRFDYFSGDLLMATEFSTAIFFGVRCIGKGISLGEKPNSSRIEAEPIGKISVKIDRKLPWYYAEKAGIDAPIHTNPEFALSIGLPGNILQGTCTLGKSVNAILQLQGIDSTSGISHIAAKFTGMILPPDIITTRILRLENGMIYFDVLNGKGKAIIKGGQIILK